MIINSFPREDSDAPRQKILREFCPHQLEVFKECLHANAGDENKCTEQKKPLTKCEKKYFRKVNNDPNYIF